MVVYEKTIPDVKHLKVIFRPPVEERIEIFMANCLECRHALVDDIFHEWYCRRDHHINVDDNAFLSSEEIECEDFEDDPMVTIC